MAEKKLRGVVIGLGYIAKEIMLPILFTSKAVKDKIEIVGINARTEKSMKQTASEYKVSKIYRSVDEMNKDELDVAFVLTPKQTHYEITKALLEKGIDVFCEKPIATNLAEARELVEVASRQKRQFMIGFNRRYAPANQKAKAQFKDAPPDVCFVEKNRPGTGYRGTLEVSIHMIDLMRFFCGEPKKVEANAQFDDPYYETSATAQVLFEKGSIGLLLLNRTCGQWMEKVELYGQGQTVIVDFPEKITVQYNDHEESVSQTPLAMGWAQATDRLGFVAEIEHFIDCVQQRTTPLTSGEDGLKTMELLNSILSDAGLPDLFAKDK